MATCRICVYIDQAVLFRKGVQTGFVAGVGVSQSSIKSAIFYGISLCKHLAVPKFDGRIFVFEVACQSGARRETHFSARCV